MYSFNYDYPNFNQANSQFVYWQQQNSNNTSSYFNMMPTNSNIALNKYPSDFIKSKTSQSLSQSCNQYQNSDIHQSSFSNQQSNYYNNSMQLSTSYNIQHQQHQPQLSANYLDYLASAMNLPSAESMSPHQRYQHQQRIQSNINNLNNECNKRRITASKSQIIKISQDENVPSINSQAASTNKKTNKQKSINNSNVKSQSPKLDENTFNSCLNKINFPLLKTDGFEQKLALTGNIFQKRNDWSIISKLPINKQNTIHTRFEDDGPYGNDEIRCFLLSHLSSKGINELPCAFCNCNLTIYDRFPLIDGTFFISPISYGKAKSISTILPSSLTQSSNQTKYLNAVCLKCLMSEEDHQIKCKQCNTSWQKQGGSSLQIGTFYKYDIFAAFPCCNPRLNCNSCNKNLIDIKLAMYQGFDSFSQQIQCPSCKKADFHFVKQLEQIFVKPSTLCNKNLM